MKFKLSVYGNDELWSSFTEDDFAKLIEGDAKFQAEYTATGELLFAGGLAESTDARVVKVVGGKTETTEGPYLDAKEFIGAFFIVEAASLERAVEIASAYPAALSQGVEVWPLMEPPTE